MFDAYRDSQRLSAGLFAPFPQSFEGTKPMLVSAEFVKTDKVFSGSFDK